MPRAPRRKPQDLIGKTIGMLTVVEVVSQKEEASRLRCRCACGKERIVTLNSLTENRSGVYSCGCKKRGKHGKPSKYPNIPLAKDNPAYHSWIRMRVVCNNPKHNSFARFGGIGIVVCERWDDFMCFLEDMGEQPEGMTLDRLDPMGDFEPGNCVWVTRRARRQTMHRAVRSLLKP